MKNGFYPSPEATQNAIDAHSKRIKRSISHLLRVMQNDAQFKDPYMERATEIVRISNRFHPETHYYHNKLITSIKNQNIRAATSECRSLIQSIMTQRHDDTIAIASIGTDHWEIDALRRAIDSAAVETGLDACALPVANEILSQQSTHLKQGLATLSQGDPSTHTELTTLIQGIKLFSGKVMQGLSDTQVFGEIYIRTPRDCVDPVPYYVEHMVHEAAHTYLNCLMADDPIVVNSVVEKFPSPLRKDLRPMYGVYHATFVAARMALTFKRIFEQTGDLRWIKMLAEVSDETIRGIKVIKGYGALTERGEAIIRDICELVPSIAKMDVWDSFDFRKPAAHRCGAGVAQYADFRSTISS